MPEGHTVHRLARAFEDAFAGGPVRAVSPQGRFGAQSARLDGQVLLGAEAVGKHLLLAFAPRLDTAPGDPSVSWVHVHLGLYGAWTFAGDEGFAVASAIGAPRRRIGEVEETPAGVDGHAPPDGDEATREGADGSERSVAVADWRRLVPRDTVRLRLIGTHGLADLTGPTACEIYDAQQRRALLARLGPDPLRPDADPERFVARVRSSRTSVGVLLMNQEVIAGVGNIYRAEALFRARLDPTVPGRELTAPLVRGIWEDLTALMTYGARTGRIVTTEPEDRDIEARILERSRGTRQNGDGGPDAVARERSFYVYHRQTLPCRLCGTPIRSGPMAGRTVFWCPSCQRHRVRRATWSREHPAARWTGAAGPGSALGIAG